MPKEMNTVGLANVSNNHWQTNEIIKRFSTPTKKKDKPLEICLTVNFTVSKIIEMHIRKLAE